MNHIYKHFLATVVLLTIVLTGCSTADPGARSTSDSQTADRGRHDRDGAEHDEEGRGEHDRDGDRHHGAEGEESGAELALNQTYDNIRHGVRLILAYDEPSNSFHGGVQNTTEQTLEQVRVEVHLSNGKELGPTTPADLEPGEKMDVKLAVNNKGFNGWTAHPEVGRNEHGHGQGDAEHDREGGEENRH